MIKVKHTDMELGRLDIGGGWTYDDEVMAAKLGTSLRRHGQLRPVLVRETADGTVAVVSGRRLVLAMREAGMPKCRVTHLGVVSHEDAQRIALSLELHFETDYAKLARAVADLLQEGDTLDALASAAPFTSERLAHMRTLTTFDWSAFRQDDGQTGLFGADMPDVPDTDPETHHVAPPPAPPLEPEPAVVPPEPVPAWVAPAVPKPAKQKAPVDDGSLSLF